MQVATVTLQRSGEHSAIVNSTYYENIRSESIDVFWAPHHVVFTLKDQSVIAYKADRVNEVSIHCDEDS